MGRILNIFKEAIGLPEVVRWKAVSDKKLTNLENHGVFELGPITLVPVGHKAVGTRLVFQTKVDITYKGRLVV